MVDAMTRTAANPTPRVSAVRPDSEKLQAPVPDDVVPEPADGDGSDVGTQDQLSATMLNERELDDNDDVVLQLQPARTLDIALRRHSTSTLSPVPEVLQKSSDRVMRCCNYC